MTTEPLPELPDSGFDGFELPQAASTRDAVAASAMTAPPLSARVGLNMGGFPSIRAERTFLSGAAGLQAQALRHYQPPQAGERGLDDQREHDDHGGPTGDFAVVVGRQPVDDVSAE